MVLNLLHNKNKQYKTLDFWSRRMLNFDFLEMGLGIVSPVHFVYVFQEKCFSCYNLVTDHIRCLIVFISWDIGQYVYCNCFANQVVTS